MTKGKAHQAVTTINPEALRVELLHLHVIRHKATIGKGDALGLVVGFVEGIVSYEDARLIVRGGDVLKIELAIFLKLEVFKTELCITLKRGVIKDDLGVGF